MPLKDQITLPSLNISHYVINYAKTSKSTNACHDDKPAQQMWRRSCRINKAV